MEEERKGLRVVYASFKPSTFVDEEGTVRERQAEGPRDFEYAVLTEKELNSLTFPPAEYIVAGLLKENTITNVNGPRGIGKSWFTYALANEVTWGGKFGPWKIRKACNVLLVDGEMPTGDSQERIHQLNNGRDYRDKPGELIVYSEGRAYQGGVDRANLGDPGWRRTVMEIAKMRGVSLIVFDNLAALTPGVDENTRIDFDPINGWLKDLRHDGISSILCSHTGKNNQQRGTSSHEDALNITIELRPQPKAPRSEYSNHCSFSMRTTKDRSMDTLYECVLFDLESTEKGVEFAYAIPTPSELDRVVVLLKGDPDISPAEARSKYEISKRTYYRAREILKKGLD